MTDDTQNSPAGETSTTPKRPRRSSAKKLETTAKIVEGSVESKDDKASAKPAAPKTSRAKTQKAPSTTGPKTTAKNSATETQTMEGVASQQADTADKSQSKANPATAIKPKPRTGRRTNAKTDNSSKTQTDNVAEAAQPEDISSPSPKGPSPKARVQREKNPAKSPGRRPSKTSTASQKGTSETSETTDNTPSEATLFVAADSVLEISSKSTTEAVPVYSTESTVQTSKLVVQAHGVQAVPTAPETPVAQPAEPVTDQNTDSHSADMDASTPPHAEDASSEEETPARKSRRGRRGGRGRSKNKAREAQSATDTDPNVVTDLADSDATELSVSSEEGTTQSVRQKPAPKAQKRSPKPAAVKIAAAADVDEDEEPRGNEKVGRRKMFISVVPGEQVEVALVEEGAIHEYYLEMLHQAKTKGNIYKGVIHNIDTNLQAAFVNYGANKNGFLQIDEVHPEYYLTHHEAMKGKKFPPMQKVLKAGQEVLVQVVKEPSGSKGAFLTTWLSLAGRFLVLTPGQEQIGVSRKVVNDEERARLREMMNGIDPGEGLGVIVRTVSAGTSKTTLKNDLQYLKRVWKDIRKRGTSEPTPSLIYQEPGLAERAVRDYLTDDVCEVWVDDGPEAEALRETVSLLFPRKGDLVHVHSDLRQTLWERFNIQRQLEQIYSREVTLPSGGRLVFDQTEALMAIDINSGKISGKGNFEAMALRTNVEAAECIARQLKLRDIGGQIVIDFIEMRDKNHIREVEKTLRSAMKNDRARHDVARMSSFGLLEIVRQRTASSALAITMEPCPACGGTGLRRNIEWQALQVMREIARLARTCGSGPCQIELATELGLYLLNHKRDRLREMEKQYNVPIEIKIRP